MVDAYEKKFGLDKPLWQQYLTYMADMSHLDFGYSLMLYPTKVLTVVLIAMPWTIGLLSVATLIAFSLGTILGALLAWPRSPRAIHYLLPPLFIFSVVPYYLFGLILVYILAFQLAHLSDERQLGIRCHPDTVLEVSSATWPTTRSCRRSRSCWPPWASGPSACAR